MPSVAAMGETAATTTKRGMKPFIHGVPITTTGASTALQQQNPLPPPPPPEQEQLPCPRCDSTNTKFCYYNNYNFSQPRYFCKSCRRYWTQGGTLRDIPVGGGTRKSAKRCRTSLTPAAAATTTSVTSSAVNSPDSSAGFEGIASPLLVGKQGATAMQYGSGGDGVGKADFFWAMGGPLGLGLDGKGNGPGSLCGSFTSLLSNPGPGLGGGTFVPGFEDVGFGLGRGIWPLHGVEDGGAGGGLGGGNITGGGITGGNTWQFESEESGFLVGGGGGDGGGDCLSWPDLSISTLGNGLK